MLSTRPTLEQVYRPRRLYLSPYYQCIEAHFEQLEGTWKTGMKGVTASGAPS